MPRQIGGNGVYAAVGMRLWQEEVQLLSVVGEDFPKSSLQQLEEHGINIDAVLTIPESHQLRSRVFYFPDGRRTDLVEEAQTIITTEAAAILDLESEYPSTGSPLHRRLWPLYSPQVQQIPENLNDVVAAHLAPGNMGNNRDLAVALKGRSQGRIMTTLDWPWWDWDHESEADKTLLANVDYLLPSLEEATVYADAIGADPFSAIRAVLKLGPRGAAIKMGSKGSRVLPGPEKEWTDIPVYETTVVDPTGAGDAFCAGYVVGMIRSGDPVTAALYGAVSASFIIESFGPLHALDTPLEQVEERLDHLKRQLKLAQPD